MEVGVAAIPPSAFYCDEHKVRSLVSPNSSIALRCLGRSMLQHA